MPDPAAVPAPDLFDLPHAADPSPHAAALLAPVPGLADDLTADLVREARPGYADPPPPFYATTGVACARLGRRFIGIEREQEFLALAINRLAEEVQQVALVFVFTGASMKRDETGRERGWSKATTWNDIVSYALTTLGGEGDLKEINRVVESNPRTLSNPTWTSTIRRVVRQSARISAVGRGRYRLWQN